MARNLDNDGDNFSAHRRADRRRDNISRLVTAIRRACLEETPHMARIKRERCVRQGAPTSGEAHAPPRIGTLTATMSRPTTEKEIPVTRHREEVHVPASHSSVAHNTILLVILDSGDVPKRKGGAGKANSLGLTGSTHAWARKYHMGGTCTVTPPKLDDKYFDEETNRAVDRIPHLRPVTLFRDQGTSRLYPLGPAKARISPRIIGYGSQTLGKCLQR